MSGDEDGDVVFPRQFDQQVPKLVPGYRVDTGCGLVQDQHVRPMDHGHRQREALAHAQGQLFSQLINRITEAEAPDHLRHPFGDLPLRQMEDAGMEHQVLAYRQLGIEGEGLGHVAHPLAGLHVMGIHATAEEPSIALRCRQQAGEHLHGRRLTAAVGAQETKDLPALYTES